MKCEQIAGKGILIGFVTDLLIFKQIFYYFNNHIVTPGSAGFRAITSNTPEENPCQRRPLCITTAADQAAEQFRIVAVIKNTPRYPVQASGTGYRPGIPIRVILAPAYHSPHI
jgi:hypothetical protein